MTKKTKAEPSPEQQAIFDKLNPVQQDAVKQTEGPVLIVAGAGSGKTRVLTHRIAYLLTQGVNPDNILAVTFTRKAAGEIKDRVKALVNQNIWIGTFHSVCLNILKIEAPKIGYTSQFSIYDDYDQLALVKQCMSKLGIKDTVIKPQVAAARIDRLKCDLIYPDDFEQHSKDDETLYQIYRLYQNHLQTNQVMDYNDLICLCIKVMEQNPSVLDKYQERFRYIMIDEYQDTNHAQYRLVKLLAAKYKNICVVGDSDQSIYGFRGADMSNFLSFEKDYENTRVFLMEQNYRSSKTILNAANALMKAAPGKRTKKLWTDKGLGENITYFRGNDEREEARFMIEAIQSYIAKGNKYSDIVIFYRVHALSRVIEEELVKSAIPYKIVGGTGFYQRKEIKELVSLLKVVAFPNDVSALKRVIQFKGKGIGPTTIKAVEQFAEQSDIPFYEALCKSEDNPFIKRTAAKKAIAAFLEFLTQLSAGAKKCTSIDDTLESILKTSGLIEIYKKVDEQESKMRIENINEFHSVAKEYDARELTPSLENFLDQILISSAIDRMEEEVDTLTLMTLHSAKGLEFPVVFILGIEEGLLPHINSMATSREIEEERRLFYVGITRAHEKLYLCSASDRLIYGYKSYRAPSQFLQQIPNSLMDKIEERFTVEGGTASDRTHYFDTPDDVLDAEEKIKNNPYTLGTLVLHPTFGPGKITQVSGQGDKLRLEIFFTQQNAKRAIMPKYAKLKIL